MRLNTQTRVLVVGAAADPIISVFGDGGTTNYTQISASGTISLKGTAAINFAGGTTYKVDSAGDATLKSLTVPSGNISITSGHLTVSAGSIIMGGTGGDDERFKLPYLTGAPATVNNGSIWMEADGLHIYYNGAEKLVAGV